VLGRLKSGIRWYILVEGFTLLIVLASLLFWLSFSVDALWFTLTKIELAEWFRIGVDALAVMLLLVAAVYWIGLRAFRKMDNQPLSLVLERRFPSFNDRLVTSVELGRTVTGKESDLTVSMLNRTIENASAEARRIRVADVFETRPVVWAVIGALVTVLITAGYGIAYPGDFKRWMNAYVSLDEEYWVRETRLQVEVIDEITGLPRSFDENRRYKHPKGGDLTLQVTVPLEDSEGRRLVVPQKVEVLYRTQDGGSMEGPIPCTKNGERSFRVSMKVRESIEVYVTGNDFINRHPYFVDVVDPPQVEKMSLRCAYPAYTGMNRDRSVSNTVEVLGNEVSVPLETKFRLDVSTNKPLLLARVEYGRYRLQFGWVPTAGAQSRSTADPKENSRFEAELISKGLPKPQADALQSAVGIGVSQSLATRQFRFPIPRENAEAFFVDDPENPGFRLPFIVSAQKSVKARRAFDTEFPDKLGRPFLMPPDTEMRIYLRDIDEISSISPEQITIHADRDVAPVIEAEKRDIGQAVTRFADIPIFAKIVDDHGVAEARIEYRTALKGRTSTEGEPWQPYELDNPPERNEDGTWDKEFRFWIEEDELVDGERVTKTREFERFKVPLIRVPGEDGTLRDLQAGDLLALSVFAADADNLNGPNTRRGAQVFDFRIVTVQELHNLLYDKESRLRIDFEKIISEVLESRQELVDRKNQLAELKRLKARKPPDDPEAAAELRKRIATLQSAIELTSRRVQAMLRKNHNETKGVEQGFRQIRAELINNKIMTARDTKRLEQGIIRELHNVNKSQGRYDLVDKALGRYNTAVDENRDPAAAIDDSIREVDELLDRLNAALKEMAALLKFQQAIKLIANIIKDEEELIEWVKRLNVEKVFGPNN